ncbi:MAG: glycosyltransferase family 4 protein [Planctomycetota bacterium]|nr:glycosyltransferase family 4 protein [Planctomycetota bacterium]
MPYQKIEELRVALVSPIGSMAGGERVLLEIARELQACGQTAKVFCLREGSWTRRGWGDDVEVVAYKPGYRIRYPWSVARAAMWLRRELQLFNPNVVHANHASWWITAWAVRGMKVATVWHLYDYPDHRDLPTRVGELFPPTATLFTSQHVASAYPRLTKRHHVIIPPITVEPQDFLQAPRDESILSKHNLKRNEFCLTVCRWQSHKGLHDLAAAVALLKGKGLLNDHLKFVLVGKPSNDAELSYRSQVLKLITTANLLDVFCFVEDCSDEELRALYTNGIALVHPALSEGFGLVLLEAMTLGTPVIACDASGPMEILNGGQGGIVVPRGNASELAMAIDRIATDGTLRESLSASAKRRASELCRREMVSQTLKLHQQILPRSNEQPS